MKAMQSFGVGAVAAAAAGMVWAKRAKVARKRDMEFERKCLDVAVEAFEGEGGLVLT